MTELKNLERELDRFRLRVFAAAAFVLIGFGLLLSRMVMLQIVRHDELSTRAENNRIAVVPIVPNRGRIVDRNGIVLATNYTAYTLEITPSKVADLEATITALAEIVDIQLKDRRRFKRQLDESKSFESLPIRTRLSDEELARFIAQRYRFPGVEVEEEESDSGDGSVDLEQEGSSEAEGGAEGGEGGDDYHRDLARA